MRRFLACILRLWGATHEITNDVRRRYTVHGTFHHRGLEGAERRRKLAETPGNRRTEIISWQTPGPSGTLRLAVTQESRRQKADGCWWNQSGPGCGIPAGLSTNTSQSQESSQAWKTPARAPR